MKNLIKYAPRTLLVIFISGSFLALNHIEEAENNIRLTDMEIAHIAYTAGNIDIRYAHLALALSDNAEVRNFAETMIRDHTKVNELALGLLNKLNAQPKDNDTSKQLLKDANRKINELSKLRSKAFDKKYAENELAYHRFVNETVETAFIPSVQNKEFKALLGEALKIFKVHENHAKNMTIKLAGGY